MTYVIFFSVFYSAINYITITNSIILPITIPNVRLLYYLFYYFFLST